MHSVSIKKTNGKFIDSIALTVKLLRLHKDEHVEHDGKYVILRDIEVGKERDNLIVEVVNKKPEPTKELNDNIDRDIRHNIGGSMNRPSKTQEDAYNENNSVPIRD